MGLHASLGNASGLEISKLGRGGHVQPGFEFNTAGSGGASTAETNNAAVLTVGSILAPSPDLQVANLAVTPAAGLQSGDNLVVNWNVLNAGNAPVKDAFFTHVTIRNTTTSQTLATADVAYDPRLTGRADCRRRFSIAAIRIHAAAGDARRRPAIVHGCRGRFQPGV